MRTWKSTLAAGSIVASLAIAGCGGSSSSSTTGGGGGGGESGKDAATILADAGAATKAAKDVHMKGTFGTTTLDGDLGGGNFNGSVTADGKTFDIVVISDASGDSNKAKVFMKAAASTWTAMGSASVASCLGDKWLEIDSSPAGSDATTSQLSQGAQSIAGGVSTFADLKSFGGAMTGSGFGTPTKGSTTTIGSQSAVEIKGTKGSIFVADSATPNILRIVSTSSSNPGSLEFTNWNAGVSFSSPSGADTLSNVAVACAVSGAGSPAPSPT